MKLLSRCVSDRETLEVERLPYFSPTHTRKTNALYHRDKKKKMFVLSNQIFWTDFPTSVSFTCLQTAEVFFFSVLSVCWSMHVVIMSLWDHLADSRLWCSFLIHFGHISIIAWVNCMHKVSILCLTLLLSGRRLCNAFFLCRHKVNHISL